MGNRNSTVDDEVNVQNDAEISIIVWFDPEVHKTVENEKAQQQLCTIVNRFKTFEDAHECEKYIRTISTKERLLLIVNDQQGRQVVSHVHACRQVISIYVYSKNNNEQWTKQFSKIKVVMKRLDELIARIKRDHEDFLIVDKVLSLHPSASSGKTNQSNNPVLLQFAYSQLLSNVLLRLNPIKPDQSELISLCKHICQNSEFELKIINEFEETYSSDTVLWWYTRLNCFSRILNQALRTHDIHTIFLFQFFIHDLHQQITKCQCQSSIRTYRSQLMIDDEMNSLKESVGLFISIHTLFSTLVDRNRAFDFLSTCDQSNGLHRVFFEIDADPQVITTKPFAEITRYSDFPQEREVLFSIGSLFRITNVRQHDDQIWIIEMTFCGDDETDLQPLFEEVKRSYGSYEGETALISFSRVLRATNRNDQAEKYCQRLLRNFTWSDTLTDVLHNELVQITSNKHEKSIQIEMKTDSSNSTEDCGNNLRFTDVATEKHEILLPIEGYEKMPLVSLEEAIQPLITILPDIRRKGHTAKLKCKHPADGLTPDESAAIMLYTMEWEPQDQCLYCALNARLRTADRNILKPWFLYLKLILTALSRLPSIQRTVYRGVRLDLSSTHQENEQFFWWGFSSCTTTVSVLKSEQYLGSSGTRTLFHIECVNGKDIQHHSYYAKEDEILLLPATYFQVTACLQMAPDLHAIQLKEIVPEFPYLEPV